MGHTRIERCLFAAQKRKKTALHPDGCTENRRRAPVEPPLAHPSVVRLAGSRRDGSNMDQSRGRRSKSATGLPPALAIHPPAQDRLSAFFEGMRDKPQVVGLAISTQPMFTRLFINWPLQRRMSCNAGDFPRAYRPIRSICVSHSKDSLLLRPGFERALATHQWIANSKFSDRIENGPTHQAAATFRANQPAVGVAQIA